MNRADCCCRPRVIRKSCVLAFADIGMEAIYEFEVKDMPVTVAAGGCVLGIPHGENPARISRGATGRYSTGPRLTSVAGFSPCGYTAGNMGFERPIRHRTR